MAIPPPASDVRRTVLPNGLRVVSDAVPGSVSATIAVWVAVGGRDEDRDDAGASHFLEHLIFKGTDRLGPTEIAFAVDGMGGDMNAYTSSEYTAYYIRVPATEVDAATELLLDVVSRPALLQQEFEGERSVILEELAAAEDDPEDVTSVRLHEALFPSHPLGRDVLGTEVTIRNLSVNRVSAFLHHWYRPRNLVVTAAGAVDHDRLVEHAAATFGDLPTGERPNRVAPVGAPRAKVAHLHPTELVHLGLGWRLPADLSADRYSFAVLNQVLGNGPASRLFQEVRERRALTYSIFSGVSHYVDSGVWAIQGATTPDNAGEVLAVIRGLVEELAERGITPEELRRAQRSLRGSLLLALEDSGSRAARLGVAEATRGHFTPIAEHLDQLDRVTVERANQVAEAALSSPHVLSIVAPDGTDLDRLG